jgi:hypothetical protein
MIVKTKLRQRSVSQTGARPRIAAEGAGGSSGCTYHRIFTTPRAPIKRGTSAGPGAEGSLQAEASRSRSPTKEMPNAPASKRPAIQDEGQLPVGRGAASGTRSTGAVASRVFSIENTMLGIEGGRAVGVGGASAPAPSAPLQGAWAGGRSWRRKRPRSFGPAPGRERPRHRGLHFGVSISECRSARPPGLCWRCKRRRTTGRAAHCGRLGGGRVQGVDGEGAQQGMPRAVSRR